MGSQSTVQLQANMTERSFSTSKNGSTDSDQGKGPYGRIADMMWMLGTPVIILVGTAGNLLTILVILKRVNKMTSTAIFLLALALSDTAILFCGPVRQWILSVWAYDLRTFSEAGCKTSLFFTYSTIQISSWLLVVVTVERAAGVAWPHKVKLGFTRKTSTIIVLIIVWSIFVLNAHFLYGTGKSTLDYYSESFCDPLFETYRHFIQKVWIWIDFCVAFAVPFVLLAVCNVFIIYVLNANRARRRHMAAIQTTRSRVDDQETRMITLTLVLLSVVFFVCVTPSAMYFLYLEYNTPHLISLWYKDKNAFQLQMDRLALVHCICSMVSYINAMFNFCMYVITGSRFRMELKALLGCLKTRDSGAVFSGGSNHREPSNQTAVASISRDSTVFTTQCVDELRVERRESMQATNAYP